MECLAGFAGRDYLVVHDGMDEDGAPIISEVVFLFDRNTGTGNANAPSGAWQHVRCGPVMTTNAMTIAINRELIEAGEPPLGDVPVVSAVPAEDAAPASTVAGVGEARRADDGGHGGAFVVGQVAGGLVLVAGLAVVGVKLHRRGDIKPRSIEKWAEAVRHEGVGTERTFSKEQKRVGLIRCGGQCEWVDEDDFERCTVVQGVNGMDLQGDHLIPDTLNGGTTLKNLSMLCPRHNGRRRTDDGVVVGKGGREMPMEWYERVFANRTPKTYARGVLALAKRDGQKPSKNEPLAPVFEFKRRAS